MPPHCLLAHGDSVITVQCVTQTLCHHYPLLCLLWWCQQSRLHSIDCRITGEWCIARNLEVVMTWLTYYPKIWLKVLRKICKICGNSPLSLPISKMGTYWAEAYRATITPTYSNFTKLWHIICLSEHRRFQAISPTCENAKYNLQNALLTTIAIPHCHHVCSTLSAIHTLMIPTVITIWDQDLHCS